MQRLQSLPDRIQFLDLVIELRVVHTFEVDDNVRRAVTAATGATAGGTLLPAPTPSGGLPPLAPLVDAESSITGVFVEIAPHLHCRDGETDQRSPNVRTSRVLETAANLQKR